MGCFMCGLVSDLVIYKFREYDAVYDAECPYWDQKLWNSIKLYCDPVMIEKS